MIMANSDSNLDRLFRAAAAEPQDTARAEFAFETRLMARLREERSGSVFAWAWRLAPFFGALAVAAGLWSRSTTAAADSLGSVISEASQGGVNVTLVNFLTGEP